MKLPTITLLTAALMMAAAVPLALGAGAATTTGPDHTVIVIMENRDRTEVIGNSNAPYENGLAGQGVDYANAQGVTHPSLGNYLALYSGSTQGQAGKDVCVRLGADNLGKQAAAAGVSLKVYMENLGTGSPLTDHGTYACRHDPAAQFTDAASGAASTDFGNFPTDFNQLPKISFVVPNLCNDTHDCGVPVGDSWLKTHMDSYVQWAKTHNSVLLVTWDENHHTTDYTTPMPTFLVGAGVSHSVQSGKINQYNMLRTVEDWYGLPRLANSASVSGMPGLPTFSTTSTTTSTSTSATSTATTTTTSTSTSGTTGTTTTAPPGTFTVSFTPTAGINAWWVEAKVASASTIASVSATVNGGSPHTLAKTSWGTYAASFNAPLGSAVAFTAKDTAGHVATAPAIAWLLSTATVTATGGTATTSTTAPSSTSATTTSATTTTATTTATTGSFTATFTPKAVGNDWWLETAVTANQPIAKVQARINGGTLVDLPKTSWGTYAKSLYAPNGSVIVFDAVSSTGQVALSQTVVWT